MPQRPQCVSLFVQGQRQPRNFSGTRDKQLLIMQGEGVLQGRAALAFPGSSGGPSLQQSENWGCSSSASVPRVLPKGHQTCSPNGLTAPSCHHPGKAQEHALLQVLPNPSMEVQPNHNPASWESSAEHSSQPLPRIPVFPAGDSWKALGGLTGTSKHLAWRA